MTKQIHLIFSGKGGIGKTSLGIALSVALAKNKKKQERPVVADLNNQNQDLWQVLEMQDFIAEVTTDRGYNRKEVSIEPESEKKIVLIKPTEKLINFKETIDFIRTMVEKEPDNEVFLCESTAFSLETLSDEEIVIDPPIEGLTIWIINRWSTTVRLDILKTYYKLIDRWGSVCKMILIWNMNRPIVEMEGKKKVGNLVKRYAKTLRVKEMVELPTEYILQSIDGLRKKGAVNEKRGVMGTWVPFFNSMFFAKDRGLPNNVFLIPYYKNFDLESVMAHEPISISEIETLLGDYYTFIHNIVFARTRQMEIVEEPVVQVNG